MQLQIYPYRLEFKHPFRLSHSIRTGTDNVYILISEEEKYGWGETVFIPYYHETLQSFKTVLEKVNLTQLDSEEKHLQAVSKNYPGNNFTIAGIDIAYHNYRQQQDGLSISKRYDIQGFQKPTSFTIGISSKNEMEEKLKEFGQLSYFKLKVSEETIAETIQNFRNLSEKPFTIDANQGFKHREKALEWAFKLADYGVAYFEQPFDKNDWESHAWLKKRSPIPIIADESFQDSTDIIRVAECFDGFNLKLMKCGGIMEAINCMRLAKDLGLKTILGCMSESSVVSNMAYQLSPLADWVDLDGPLLLKNDPFQSNSTSLEEQLKKLRT